MSKAKAETKDTLLHVRVDSRWGGLVARITLPRVVQVSGNSQAVAKKIEELLGLLRECTVVREK